MEETITHRWMEAILETVRRDQEVRQNRLLRLVQDLAQLHPSTVDLIIRQLEELITSSNVEIRVMVVRALGKLGRSSPTQWLIGVLGDQHKVVREAAAKALVEWGEYVPVDALVESCRSRSPVVRIDLILRALGDEYELVSEVALDILKKIVSNLPKEQLVAMLESQHAVVRANAIQALGEQAPLEMLQNALGDSSEAVRLAALDSLLLMYPETRSIIVEEVTSALLQKNASPHLESVAQSFVLDMIRQMDNVSSVLRDNVTKLLTWPYWEVQVKAAQTLAMLHQNVPTEALDQLQNLRNSSPSRSVREAADDALAELLSLEMSFEDKEFPMSSAKE